MSQKRNLNKVIHKVQLEQNLTRTQALQSLSIKYGMSYSVLHAIAKHGKMPTRKGSVEALTKIIKENS